MSTQLYDLFADDEWDGWRLQKVGSECAESIFPTKEAALRLLHEATQRGGIVLIYNEFGDVERKVTIR